MKTENEHMIEMLNELISLQRAQDTKMRFLEEDIIEMKHMLGVIGETQARYLAEILGYVEQGGGGSTGGSPKGRDRFQVEVM